MDSEEKIKAKMIQISKDSYRFSSMDGDGITSEENVLKMERKGGVRYISIEINKLPLKFIFDTGASNICISISEAKVLYKQGSLTQDDFIGKANFQDATGKISEGMKINLREVKIGNRTLHNLQALVVDNEEAPLLLGQSALEKFGSIEIDNKKDLIILKD
ncbi:TIGR02281 family clan AA aspartic protease [Capnocytophaga canimorsus]|uniref:TIGR02281 family clan AA aspartic protease n=1 Tax=Capnocytophaga canimorsus TaxID=28188 RepID=UPI0037D0699E